MSSDVDPQPSEPAPSARPDDDSGGWAFPFAIDPGLRPWSRAFLVHPEACMVLVTPAQLTIAFGRWSLSTSPSNIVDATVTGPYRRWKVAGPPHLSLADRGITFATNATRGVCLTFREPVAAAEPLGLLRHPAATVTVADPDAFIAAVLSARDAAARGSGAPVAEAAGPRQGTFRESAAAIVRWQRRTPDRVALVEEDVETITPPAVGNTVGSDLQRFEDGVGPAFHRRFDVVVDRSQMDARALMQLVQADPGILYNARLAPVTKVQGRLGTMTVGDRFVIALAGPWSGPVEVVDVTPTSFRMATLRGHLEAGAIELAAEDAGPGAVGFRVESWARSGDRAFRTMYDVLGVAQALQSEMWVEACEAVARVVGGVPRGPVDVLTERAESPGHAP